MSAAHVEALFRELCAHCDALLPWLSPALTAAVDEAALEGVPASAAHRFRCAALSWTREGIRSA